MALQLTQDSRGCVSGAQVQGMRESTSAGGEDGEYDWDLIDGYDELG